MNTTVKKVSVSALMFMMVFALFASYVPQAHAAFVTGDLVKGPNSDAVYYVNGTTKHVFPDKKTYMTWYANFDAVKKVTVAELDTLTTGAAVSYRPGTKFVTHPNTANVYAVEGGAVLRKITSETCAATVYGSDWAKWVQDVHEVTFGGYTMGADIDCTHASKGTLLKKTGETTIYYVDGTTIKPFADSAAFNTNNLNANYVWTVASLSAYTTGSSITGAETFATISGTGTGTITGPAGTVTVALSPNTPAANQILMRRAARVPMVTIDLTAGNTDVIVDSLTIERKGVASDSPFSSFDLLDAATMAPLNNNSKTLNSSHTSVFNDDFTVLANTKKTVIVAANMLTTSLANYASEYPAMAVTAIALKNNSTLSGTLPITGNTALINGSLTVGTATVVSGSNNPSAATKEVGTKDYIVSSIKITNDSTETAQTLRVTAMTFTNNGSTGATDVENVRLINTNTGTTIGTVATPTGKTITFSGLSIEILKGNNINFDLKLDIKSGSARTIRYDIDKQADIVAYDVMRGFNVLPDYTGYSSSPYYTAPLTTVGNGKLRIESLTVTPNQISRNKNGVLLGKFKFVMAGEVGNITSLGLKVSTTTTAGAGATALTSDLLVADLTNLTIKDASGNTVAGPVDMIANQANNGFTATTTDTISVPVGETVYSVYGNLSNDWTANDKIQIGIFAGAITLKGDTSGNTITATPTAQVQSTNMTIKAADLNVSVFSSPTAQTVVAGAPDYEAANIILDASDSGTDVRVTNFGVIVHTTVNVFPDMFSAPKLYVGTTLIPSSGSSTSCSGASCSTAGTNATTTLTIQSGDLTIPAGQSKTVRIVGNIGTGASSGTFSVGMVSGGLTTLDSSGNSFTPDYTNGDGQAMSLVTGGILDMSVATEPQAALVVAGTTLNVGQFTAQARYEGMNVKSFGFLIGAPDGGLSQTTSAYKQLDSLELWESGGSSALGTITVNGQYATITPTSYIINQAQSKSLVVKAKFKSVIDPSIAVSGSGMDVTLTNVDVTGTSAGSSSVTLNGHNTAFNSFHSFRSIPTVTTLSITPDQLIAASYDVDLYKFSISANSAGPIALFKFTFGVATSSGSLIMNTAGYRVYHSAVSTSFTDILSDTGDVAVTQAIPTNLSAQHLVQARFDYLNNNSNNMSSADLGEPFVIEAGSTVYFLLRGSASAISATANDDTISTVLAGDSSFASTGTTYQDARMIDGTIDQDDFIWSDMNWVTNPSSSTNTKTKGWFNGYRVTGLPTNSTTAQAQTD